MLRWRIILGTVLAAAVIALCYFDARATVPGILLMPLALAVTLLASGELTHLLSVRSAGPRPLVVYLGNAAIVATNWLPWIWPAYPLAGWSCLIAALVVALIVALLVEMAHFAGEVGHAERLAFACFSFLYIGLLWSFTVRLRFVGPNAAWGLTALLSLILVVKFSDIGAFFVGRTFGRHKMSPRISPNKTIEGALGGLASACLAAWFALVFLFPRIGGDAPPTISIARAIVFGLAVGVAGMVGDLAESLLKRDSRQKDSSAWMPGLGGVLDLIDSLLVAGPVAYLLWSSGWLFG